MDTCLEWSSAGFGEWYIAVPVIVIAVPVIVTDPPEWVVKQSKMFADDTKLWRTMSDESDSTTLQNDPNRLTEWSRRWQLKFNPSKCKLMHIGHKSRTNYYKNEDSGNRIMIAEVKEEKDLRSTSGMILSQVPSV